MSREIIPTLDLIRFHTTEDYTQGILLQDNMPIGYSLELDWQGNERYESCIPAGNYICKWAPSSKLTKYDVIWIEDVQGRSECQVHYGNWIYQILGCILVGDSFSPEAKERPDSEGKMRKTGGIKINNSLAKLAELKRLFPDEELLLRISWCLRTLTPTS